MVTNAGAMCLILGIQEYNLNTELFLSSFECSRENNMTSTFGDSLFNTAKNVCSDDCAQEAKDVQNEGIFGYETYNYLPVECDGEHARYPDFSYDHINLRGRPGYGLADGCVVDKYSELRNDPAQLTRDRCRTQLFSRIFQGCPNLRGGVVNPDQEMPILQGTGSRDFDGYLFMCKRSITELETYHPTPLLDCVKEVQNPDHCVESWVRGGDPTRDFIRRQEFLQQCGSLASERGGNTASAHKHAAFLH
jgi:hypothetical protein